MPDATLAKIVALLEPDAAPALRLAALTLAGQVGSAKEKSLVQALIRTLDDAQSETRVLAIQALGQLKVEEALPRLEAFARQGGPELDVAVHAASQLGAKGAKRMSLVLDEAHPFLRARIAGVLAKAGTGNALVVTGHALLDPDPKVAQAAARSLAAEVPTFTSAQKQALAKFLVETLNDGKALTPVSEVGLLRVLGNLHDARGEEICWSRLSPATNRDIRIAALQALGAKAQPGTDARLQTLLTCAADKDFQIVAAALMLLKDVPIGKKPSKGWLGLFDAPDVATRRFALEKLQGTGSADWARTLITQVDHTDRAYREQVLAELGSFPQGRDALLEKLTSTTNPDACWFLARSLATLKVKLSADQKKSLLQEALEHHTANDRRGPALWFLLRELEHDWTREQLEEHALALRKKKKYAEAVDLYRLLVQDPACGEETRFELAVTSLRISQHDLAADARQNDPALHQFSRLLQNSTFDLVSRLKKAKWLEPEDLFYLGFHYIEQTHRAHEFGKEVLELVVERSPKSEVGKNAKRKLKMG